MSTPGLMLLISALLLGYMEQARSQVSFSTHWGGGKRSSIFNSKADDRSRPSIFNTGKAPSIFDTANELPQMFTDKNDLWQCLARMETNVMKYISLILEVWYKEYLSC